MFRNIERGDFTLDFFCISNSREDVSLGLFCEYSFKGYPSDDLSGLEEHEGLLVEGDCDVFANALLTQMETKHMKFSVVKNI